VNRWGNYRLPSSKPRKNRELPNDPGLRRLDFRVVGRRSLQVTLKVDNLLILPRNKTSLRFCWLTPVRLISMLVSATFGEEPERSAFENTLRQRGSGEELPKRGSETGELIGESYPGWLCMFAGGNGKR